ncbi:hypothetical protein ACND5R_005147 [Escherichia coli]
MVMSDTLALLYCAAVSGTPLASVMRTVTCIKSVSPSAILPPSV